MIHHGVVEIPKAWQTAGVQFAVPAMTGVDSLAGLIVLSIVLTDGTNLIVLHFERTTRWMRMGIPTSWRVEELYEGQPPRAEVADTIDETWHSLLECAISARNQADDELGGHRP